PAPMILVLAALLAGPAGDASARAVVDRAIKAHGGQAALTRAATSRRTEKGTLRVADRDVPLVRRIVQALPAGMRVEIVLGERIRSLVVLDGETAWQADGGPAAPLSARRARELRDETHAEWVSTLVPLLGTGFNLEALPDEKGQAGVKATFKDR